MQKWAKEKVFGLLLVMLSLALPVHGQEKQLTNHMSSQNIPKMAWAHYCGWGFNFDKIYDIPNRFTSTYDRTTLGKWVGSDTGAYSNTRNQILSAKRYGLDGFCVDLLSTKVFASAMGRFYRAAEGLDFRIALCVDGWHEPMDQVIAGMTEFLERWGDHPNNAYIDGKPVIFMYKVQKTPEQCKQILDALAAKGLKAYWLLQPQRETTLWQNTELISRYMQVFDGLYDFGINGYSQEDNNRRLLNGRKALAQAGKPDGLLCAGITQGYIGPHNGFYRPFFGTGSFQMNWNAALKANAQWVCLCTWNDYWETTHFEPSVWGNDVLLSLNQEKLRTWRNQPLYARTPQVFVSYPQEVRMGDHWELELVSLPYTTNQASAILRLVDFEGKTVEESKPIVLPKDQEFIHRFTFTDLGIDTPNRLKIMVKIQDDSQEQKPNENWIRLYPLTIRPGQMLSMRTIRFNLARMYDTYASTQLNDKKLTATLKSWTWVGKADLYQNTQFIASQNIAKFGGMDTRVSFDLTDVPQQYPRDLYTVRFSRDDGTLLWSNPLLVDAPDVDLKQTVDYPVLKRHMTFDHAWLGQVTGYKLKHPPYQIVKHKLPLAEIFTVHLPMDHRDPLGQLIDIGGWHWPALIGGSHRFGRQNDKDMPQWVEQSGPNGSTRKVLSFDGENDRIALKARSMPHDMATVEVWIKPSMTAGMPMSIFSDQNNAMHLGLNEQGLPFVECHQKIAIASQLISTEEWTHLDGSYDGQFVRLWVNGKEVAQSLNPYQSHGFNSLGMIGGLIREGSNLQHPYRGFMAGFVLRALPAKDDGLVMYPKQ